jgi:hypothetical protein
MCTCSSGCDEPLSTIVASWVGLCELTEMWVYFCNMSLGLWCTIVESKDGGQWQWWMSCEFILMEQERRRMRARSWPRDRRSRVNSHGGWHLGTPTGTRTWWSRSCCRCDCGLTGHVSRTWAAHMEYATHDSIHGWASKPPCDSLLVSPSWGPNT